MLLNWVLNWALASRCSHHYIFACKHVYLGANEILPVIIATDLSQEALLVALRDNKKVIVWTIANIKEISPTIMQHKIHLIDEENPQMRLNLVIKVVRKDILKSLDNGVIYLISDSSWISHAQVMPKKSGIAGI